MVEEETGLDNGGGIVLRSPLASHHHVRLTTDKKTSGAVIRRGRSNCSAVLWLEPCMWSNRYKTDETSEAESLHSVLFCRRRSRNACLLALL